MMDDFSSIAMAAAKAWRISCTAADIEPVAVATAAQNVRANHLHPWINCYRAAGFRGLDARLDARRSAPYELIMANILAAPLRRLAPDMARYLAPGGRVILSGLLRKQARGVLSVYRGWGLIPDDRIDLGEWSSLLLRKRSK